MTAQEKAPKKRPPMGVPLLVSVNGNYVVARAVNTEGRIAWELMNERGEVERTLPSPPENWRVPSPFGERALRKTRKNSALTISQAAEHNEYPEEVYVMAVRHLRGEPVAHLVPESTLSPAMLRKMMLLLCQDIGRRDGHTFDTFHAMKPWKFKLARQIEEERVARFGSNPSLQARRP